MQCERPRNAMVLAAGLGKRMRPITDTMPKPLVPVAGKTLLDWGLDALAAEGVEQAVVNVHYLADQIEAHVASRAVPRVIVSDERAELLDSAGGIVKALPILGDKPFFILNADTFWLDEGWLGTGPSSVSRLARLWDGERMDILLMLASMDDVTGHSGSTDFLLDEEGRLSRAQGDPAGHVYAGAGIVHPRIFAGVEARPHSLNAYFDRAIAEGRLFGMLMRGRWITVGTPDAIAPAEAAVAAFGHPAQ